MVKLSGTWRRASMNPGFPATFDTGPVVLSWMKEGRDGIEDCGDGKSFEFQSIDSRNEYIATQGTPLASTSSLWKRTATFIPADHRVCQRSDDWDIRGWDKNHN